MKLAVLKTSVGLIAVVAAPSSALAGSNAKEQARIRKVTVDYASCVVRKHHAKASEAILATANNDVIMDQFAQVIDADCLEAAAGFSVNMRFPNDTYRFALADALVNADFASHGDISFADRLPLAQPLLVTPEQQTQLLAKAKNDRERKEVPENVGKQNSLAWLSRYGECVARQDPVNARYWLLTPPDTPEETSRIVALQPAFSVCLSDGTLKLNRIAMRGTVAVNYYRLAMATTVPTAGSSH